LPWPDETRLNTLPIAPISCDQTLGDVVIEAFGCELPLDVQAIMAQQPHTVWINLEYLSAESFVERSHGLASPVLSGPAKGCTKWFFYPGFTPRTGGLIREATLLQRQQAFDPDQWRAAHGLPTDAQALWVSVFCYDTADLSSVLDSLISPTPDQQDDLSRHTASTTKVHWLITPGKASVAFAKAAALLTAHNRWPNHWFTHPLPYLSQDDFDHLLWSCDLNIVRGEDSLVRALWANRALLWHIYPQEDLAHHPKLQAFWDGCDAPDVSRALHQQLNGMPQTVRLPPQGIEPIIGALAATTAKIRQNLLNQRDLSAVLMDFCLNKRQSI
jgi:uncharacterized repeat protein (TIGR03837 family)